MDNKFSRRRGEMARFGIEQEGKPEKMLWGNREEKALRNICVVALKGEQEV